MSFLKSRILNISFKYKWIEYLLFVYLFLVFLSYIFSYSIDLDGMEFSFLFHLQVLKKYGTVYTNPDSFPYFICFYPPFYAAFMQKFCSIMQVNIFTDMHRALVWGRLISLILLFVNVRFIIKITQLFIQKKTSFIQVSLLLLLLLPMHFFSFRPDSFKVIFFTGFLFYYLRHHVQTHSRKDLLKALVAAVISIFFKHDVVFYIYLFIGLHWLFFMKKEIIFFMIGLSIVTFSGFIFFTGLFGNQFIKNLFFYTVQYSSDIRINLLSIAVNIIKTFPFLLIAYFNFQSSNRNIKFLAVAGIVFSLVSNLFLLRAGANLNYTYESILLLIIGFIIYISTKQPLQFKFILLLLFLFVINNKVSQPLYLKEEHSEEAKKAYFENLESGKILKNLIGNDVVFFTNGKYIIFNGTLNIMYGYDLHLERFTQVYMNMPIKSTMFKNASTEEYDEKFRNGFVQYIVVENNPVAINQIKEYYTQYAFLQKAGNLLVYKYQRAL
jgi:hypothetical protein